MDIRLTPALTLLDSVVRFGEYDYRVKSKSAKVSRVAYELRIIFGYVCTVRVPYYDCIYNRTYYTRTVLSKCSASGTRL